LDGGGGQGDEKGSVAYLLGDGLELDFLPPPQLDDQDAALLLLKLQVVQILAGVHRHHVGIIAAEERRLV
jgi:hypothetical protein